jgi:adenine/guanine/hypoxanthine permease
MVGEARHIDFDDLTERFPAFATIAMLVFTHSTWNGLTAGLLLHPIARVAAGQLRDVTAGAWVLAGLCAS